jgi:hypothetical protein
MNSARWRGIAGVVTVTLLCIATLPISAQQPPASRSLTLPVAGTFQGGGEFKGTISISRFAQDGNRIVAVGIISGALSRGSRTLGTVVAGERAWPVTLRSDGHVVLTSGPASRNGQLVRAVWSPQRAAGRYLLVQAETCPVLNVALGPLNVDLMGFQVALGAVTLDLTGVMGTPLGDLVCQVEALIGNVAGLVGLLNSILGLLTGLLGGLTGGLGGGLPV